VLTATSVTAAVVTSHTVARAAGDDESMAVGLKKFEEGRKAFEAGKFEPALVAFKASLELLASPNTRLYIGRCYRSLGKTASAYVELKRAAAEAQDRLTATNEKRYGVTRDVANQEAAEIEKKVPHLSIAVPGGTPPGFVVKVDGKELPQAAWGIATETDPGTVVVQATATRMVPFQTSVVLTEGSTARVDVRVDRVPTATLAIKLRTLPAGLALSLDGQPIATQGTDQPRDLDPGPHTLVAAAPGYVDFKWSNQLANNDAAVVDVSLAPNPNAGGGPRGTPKWMFWTVAGVSVATLAAGTVVALYAENQQNQQLALPELARSQSTRSSIQTQATITDILFVGGGVLGAAAVFLGFTTRWKTEGSPQGLSVAPWVTAGAAGVGAHASF
jgi:hypothetical protein